MAKKVRTAEDLFYRVEDVMRLLGYSRSKSYKVIAQLNRELKEKGYCTCDGRISRRYFDRRFGLEEPAGAKAMALA